MIAPSVLPGRAFQNTDRVSRCLFHWRAADFSLNALTGQTATFARASAGGATEDAIGRLITPVHSQPRFAMADADRDGIREAPALIMEGLRTNLIPYSEDFSVWDKGSDVALTPGQPGPDGKASATLATITGLSNAMSVAVGYTGDGVKCASINLKNVSATTTRLSLHDSSASTIRHRVQINWTGSVPSVTTQAGSGIVGTAIPLVDGWYRIEFNANGVIAANTTRFYIYPEMTGGAILIHGAQTEDAYWPSTYIQTVGSTATRSGDLLQWAFDALPQSLTYYTRMQDLGNVGVGGRRVFQIGSSLNDAPRLALTTGSGGSSYAHVFSPTPSLNETAFAPIGPVIGDFIEFAGSILPDGRSIIHQCVNGGPISTSSYTNPVPLPSAWAAPNIYLNQSTSGSRGAAAFLCLKVAAGVRSMQEMRELL